MSMETIDRWAMIISFIFSQDMDLSSCPSTPVTVAIIDVETTGLDVNKDRVLQFACLKLNDAGRPIQLYETYLNPGKDMCRIRNSAAYAINKIGESLLMDAPTFASKGKEILGLFSDVDVVIGHNVAFDYEMIRKEFERLSQNEDGMETESDESWNASNYLAGGSSDNQREILNKFDGCSFSLLDTYKLALVVFPMQKSYKLSNLAKLLGVRVVKKLAAKYVWESSTSGKEIYANLHEQNPGFEMEEHNAITDVLETEALVSKCLSNLNIKFIDIAQGKHKEYEVSKELLQLTNDWLDKSPTKEELISLVKVVPEHMNVNHPERSTKLKDMCASSIEKVIQYLSDKKSLMEKRQKMVCQGFLYTLSDKTLVKELKTSAGSNFQKNESETKSRVNIEGSSKSNRNGKSSPPLENKMHKNNLCGTKRKGEDEETISNDCGLEDNETSYTKITKIDKQVNTTKLSSRESKKQHQQALENEDSALKSLKEALEEVKEENNCKKNEKSKQAIKATGENADNSKCCKTEGEGLQGFGASQEFPVQSSEKKTPEKNMKQDEDYKSQLMFSPSF